MLRRCRLTARVLSTLRRCWLTARVLAVLRRGWLTARDLFIFRLRWDYRNLALLTRLALRRGLWLGWFRHTLESDLGKGWWVLDFWLGVSSGVQSPRCTRHRQRVRTLLDPGWSEGGPLRCLTTGTRHSSLCSRRTRFPFPPSGLRSISTDRTLGPSSRSNESRAKSARILSRTCATFHWRTPRRRDEKVGIVCVGETRPTFLETASLSGNLPSRPRGLISDGAKEI